MLYEDVNDHFYHRQSLTLRDFKQIVSRVSSVKLGARVSVRVSDSIRIAVIYLTTLSNR